MTGKGRRPGAVGALDPGLLLFSTREDCGSGEGERDP